MKRTEAQKEYQRQMAELQREGTRNKPKKNRRPFRDTKVYFYGIRIMIILIIMWLISLFDTAFYQIINMFR